MANKRDCCNHCHGKSVGDTVAVFSKFFLLWFYVEYVIFKWILLSIDLWFNYYVNLNKVMGNKSDCCNHCHVKSVGDTVMMFSKFFYITSFMLFLKIKQ